MKTFYIWTESEESLDFSKFHHNLKFTYEKSKKKIKLFDVVIKIKEVMIVTDLYCKPADGHRYLYHHSCYADHIKQLIIFSQALRLKIICSKKNNLSVYVEDFKIWFRKKGYSDYLIKD